MSDQRLLLLYWCWDGVCAIEVHLCPRDCAQDIDVAPLGATPTTSRTEGKSFPHPQEITALYLS